MATRQLRPRWKNSRGEVAAADLDGELGADEAEVAAELDQEVAELGDQRPVQIGLGVAGGQVEELDDVGVLEDRQGVGMGLSHHWRDHWRVQDGPLEQGGAELPFQLSAGPSFLSG